MKRRTKRIYYGPPGAEKSKWWTVKVRDAKHAVTLNGSVEDALKSRAGTTVGCTLSRVGINPRNVTAYPHKAYLVVVSKRTALVVDSLKANGEPRTAILYEHSYGDLVDCNDDRKIKRMVAENPSLMQRSFTLRVPRQQTQDSGPNAGKTKPGDRGSRPGAYVPRGALRRAVRAGLISGNVARQITEVAAR